LLTDQSKLSEQCKLARWLAQNIQLSQADYDTKPLLVHAVCCSTTVPKNQQARYSSRFWATQSPIVMQHLPAFGEQPAVFSRLLQVFH